MRDRNWFERIARRISANVETAHRAIRKAGRAFMGRKAALAAWFARRASVVRGEARPARGYLPHAYLGDEHVASDGP